MFLRHFLFLDTDALSDYLATIEGSILEGTIDQTETGKRERGGKLGARVASIGIEASASSGGSTENKQKRAIPDPARFQRLYALLEDEGAIQALDAFDQEIWNQLRRGEMVEVQANIHVSEAFTKTQLAENATPFIELIDAFGLSTPQFKKDLEVMQKVGKSVDVRPVPLLFEPIGAPEFGFVTHLSKQYLRCELSELQGEVIVFGKIQRIIPKGSQEEVFHILPPGMMLNKTPAQRRQILQGSVKRGVAEVLKGPAIVLTPLALYR